MRASLVRTALAWVVAAATLNAAGQSPRWSGTVLIAYPEGEEISVERNGQTLTVQPPGPRRAGHHTYQGLSPTGDFIATSYVRTPYPHYREGVAVYSVARGTWRLYEGAESDYVWSVSFSPDGSTLACKIERDDSRGPCDVRTSRQLVLLSLDTGHTRVLIDPFTGSEPVTWSPDGARIAYERIIPPPVAGAESPGYEVRIRELETAQDVGFAVGTSPSWSPSGEWIAYRHDGVDYMTRPDGSGTVALVRPPRVWPWFLKRRFADPAVWSPDSRHVLLNSPVDDETARVNVYQFDLDTRRLERKTGKGPEALGWSR